jgi:excisionase family DNA binding protein
MRRKKMEAVLTEVPELVGKRNLKIPEAATYLGLGRSKIYELISSGRLKSVKLDNARRIPVWAVQEFLAQHDGSGAI